MHRVYPHFLKNPDFAESPTHHCAMGLTFDFKKLQVLQKCWLFGGGGEWGFLVGVRGLTYTKSCLIYIAIETKNKIV